MEMLLALLAICVWNPPGGGSIGGFPVMESFNVPSVVSPNMLLNKQLSFQWFQISWCSSDAIVINVLSVI